MLYKSQTDGNYWNLKNIYLANLIIYEIKRLAYFNDLLFFKSLDQCSFLNKYFCSNKKNHYIGWL